MESTSSNISSEINTYAKQHKLDQEGYEERRNFKTTLEAILKKHCAQNAKLVFYGSCVNGFGLSSSDIDMSYQISLQPTTAYRLGYILEKETAIATLRKVERILRRECDDIGDLELVEDATIPLIRGVDINTDIRWQITSDNKQPVQASQILRSYSRMDPRAVALVIVIKRWAGHHDINNARDRTPNNYCWTLLVLYYLQVVCSPPVVDNAVIAASSSVFESQNKQSLGSLLTGFFEFYADNIGCNKVFSLRQNKLLEKWYVRGRPPRRQWDCLLCVEDPCSGDNVPRSVFKHEQFFKIQTKIRNTLRLLKSPSTSLVDIF